MRKRTKTKIQAAIVVALICACIYCIVWRNERERIKEEKFNIPKTEQQAEAQEVLGEMTQEMINTFE